MAKCDVCNNVMFGGIKKDGNTFCSEKCSNSFTPPNTSVTCGKCGTENSLNDKKCIECNDYLHQYKTSSDKDLVNCPHCSEQIQSTATTCPHCKQAIFSHNKQTNAIVGMISFVIIFLVLYYAYSSFINYEAQRQYQNIQEQAEKDTKKLMDDIKRQMNQ